MKKIISLALSLIMIFTMAIPAFAAEEEYPTIYQPFPDGRAIRALAIDDRSFPAIEIELVNKDGNVEKVCLVEYNSERGEGQEVCIGTYSEGEDEPTHYYSYYDKGEKNNDLWICALQHQ